MADIIQLRRDTAANWTSADPTLAEGEAGIELDTSKIKFGDGITEWSALPYFNGGAGDAFSSATSSNNQITRYDGSNNKTVKASLATIDDDGSIDIPSGQTYKIDGTSLNADNIPDGSTNAIITLTQETNFETAYSHSQATSGNPHSVSKSDVGLGNVTNIKCKLDATSAPTVDNDIDEGYSVGSFWHDVTNDLSYVCLDNTDGAAVWLNITKQGTLTTSSIITEPITGHIETPANKTYYIGIQMPCGGTITSVTTKCDSGSCTATFNINGTPLGGTANSVSSSEQEQAHSSANVFSAGDDITMVVSSNSSCDDMRFTVKFTRALS